MTGATQRLTSTAHPTRATAAVRDVMSVPAMTVTATEPFPALVDQLLDHDIGALPVVTPDGVLEGIVTEADLVTKAGYGGHRRRTLEVLGDLVAGGETSWAIKARGLHAGDVMSRDVVTAVPHEPLRRAARRMVDQEKTHLVVVDGERHVVGMLSRRDLLRRMHQPDAALEHQVADVLRDPIQVPEDHELEAHVHDGVVSLVGTVRDPSDLAVVVSAIWRLMGVVEVRCEVRARTAGI